MYLLDSNIFLEILLEQEKSNVCKNFLGKLTWSEIYISRFSCYSIGLILSRLDKADEYAVFITDIVEKINLVALAAEDLKQLPITMSKFNIDFDDAYQYLCVKKFDLKLLSLDKDFDKTDIVRIEP